MRTNVNPFANNLRPEWNRGPQGLTPKQEAARLKEVANEFEAIMMEQMVREMRKAVPKGDLLGREIGQEMFNEMLDGEFVQQMVKRGGIGLTDVLTDALGGKNENPAPTGSSFPTSRR